MQTSSTRKIKPPFANLYTHKTATTESACWVCGKLSTAVLTHNDLDWFYVCLSHLDDLSFCRPLLPPVVVKSAVTPQVKVEEEKKSEASQKEEKKDEKSSGESDTKSDEKEKKTPPKKVSKAPLISLDTPPVTIKPKEFVLDQRFFYMREQKYRSKIESKNASQFAKQVLSTLPSVPK